MKILYIKNFVVTNKTYWLRNHSEEATGPKGCGFEPSQGDVFKGDKSPQHTFLSDGK
jgi:hypothetical protein